MTTGSPPSEGYPSSEALAQQELRDAIVDAHQRALLTHGVQKFVGLAPEHDGTVQSGLSDIDFSPGYDDNGALKPDYEPPKADILELGEPLPFVLLTSFTPQDFVNSHGVGGSEDDAGLLPKVVSVAFTGEHGDDDRADAYIYILPEGPPVAIDGRIVGDVMRETEGQSGDDGGLSYGDLRIIDYLRGSDRVAEVHPLSAETCQTLAAEIRAADVQIT